MSANRQWLFFLTRDFGMLQLFNDFRAMSNEQVVEYIFGALEFLRS
jgi:hypothetical protein